MAVPVEYSGWEMFSEQVSDVDVASNLPAVILNSLGYIITGPFERLNGMCFAAR